MTANTHTDQFVVHGVARVAHLSRGSKRHFPSTWGKNTITLRAVDYSHGQLPEFFYSSEELVIAHLEHHFGTWVMIIESNGCLYFAKVHQWNT